MKIKVDNSKKQVIISAQAFQKATEEDLAIVKKYQSINYEVIIKEPKRVKGDKITKADIEAGLQNDPVNLKKFQEICKKSNFFAGKRFYKELTK